jgi:hypothetical protein
MSYRFQPLPTAPGHNIKAQAGWMTFRFMAGTAKLALLFRAI